MGELCAGDGTLYRISMNSPSGGTKDTTRSRSKRLYRTQGWKEESVTTSGLLKMRVRSGVPLMWHLALIVPRTSLLMTAPLVSMTQSISSEMSKKISFWAYFAPCETGGKQPETEAVTEDGEGKQIDKTGRRRQKDR